MAGLATAHAKDIESRAYSNAPVGVNFLIAGYAYTQGGIAFDHALPVKNPDLYIHRAILAYARAFGLWGKSGKFGVIVPYTWLKGTADLDGREIEREVTGFGDAGFRLSVNVI